MTEQEARDAIADRLADPKIPLGFCVGMMIAALENFGNEHERRFAQEMDTFIKRKFAQ